MTWRKLFAAPQSERDTYDTPAPTATADIGRLELGSETWFYVKRYAESEIARLRERNDGALDEIATATLRGQVKALKRMIALGNPKADKRRLSVDDD